MNRRAKAVMEAFWNSHQQDREYWHRDGVADALHEVVNQLKDIGITEKNILDLCDQLENYD